MTRKKVFVALSGGVDSSAAAALLKERGFDVCGIHIKMWGPKDSSQLPAPSYQLDTTCRQQYQDRLDAMVVAATLAIPFQTWDFTEEYRKAVVEYMIAEYAAGRTPNPDVMCNRHIKFGLFLKKALEAGADYIATGHYARLREQTGTRQVILSDSEGSPQDSSATPQNDGEARYELLQAVDKNKDQSYFLWTLIQDRLRHCLFPIGEYAKPEVRALARKFGLATAEKPDSRGICFIGEINVHQFLSQYIPERRGQVLTTAGKPVGEHNGAEFYTIGQRQGLAIGGGIPYYVADKNLETNTLLVAEGPYDEKLFRKELIATDINWISGYEPGFPLECEARIRYRQPLQACMVERISTKVRRVGTNHEFVIRENSSSDSSMIRVIFNEPQRAITPGQSVVFYRGEEMLGGGIIA